MSRQTFSLDDSEMAVLYSKDTAKREATMTERMEELIDVVGTETVELLKKKNRAYGNSIHTATEIIKLMCPDGVPVDKIDDMLVIVRIQDKFSRMLKGEKKAFDENPWKDVVGYAILQCVKEKLAEESKDK